MSFHFEAILLFFLVIHHGSHQKTEEDEQLWQEARNELARRTREYIKNNPISSDLQAFIDELRSPKRRKRQKESTEDSLLSDNGNGGFQGGNSQRAILGRGQGLIGIRDRNRGHKLEDSEDASLETPNRAAVVESPRINTQTEETVVDNLIDDKLKSTSESTELNRVLEDVQNLIVASKKGKGSSKEGALCNVSGYWDSDAGGISFHIKKTDSETEIAMRSTEPPSEDGFIAQDKWNATARIPFSQSSQIIITLTAYKGRRVALFLGECRICDGSETITGDWVLGRTSSDCKDQKAAHSFISDIFRKNNIEKLREAHIKKISTMTTIRSSTDI
ncbi:uncharacterized protein LOC109536199 isoform X2 [Dendroctonus ponderosae]|uniref:uncharacterized protein LOC109536199 isoform X2 n=1 Tax=Dendroctonus ponderosae TaxID=77166 RepID=UPI002034DD0A|nr:uncharacterized protein LOC109536199 isoform X2 [Dendroctonus ponderosae]